MKKAIILHGMPGKEEYYSEDYPSASNSHWLPWLQKQLLINNIAAYTPELPHSYQPDYQVWQREFERYSLDKDTILVGHSCGAGFLLRWMSENLQQKADKLVLVAPWLDPDRGATNDFFEFELDLDLGQRVEQIHLFFSTDDDPEIISSVNLIKKQLSSLKIHQFQDKGHFTLSDLNSDRFPELLQAVIG